MLAMLGAELPSGESISMPAPMKAVLSTILAMDITTSPSHKRQITSVLGQGGEPVQLNRFVAAFFLLIG
jgi:hypothetical protein